MARTTRQVSATEAGEALLAVVWPSLDALCGAMAKVGERATAPRGTLRVTASRVAYQAVLQPVLGDFLARHPRIELEVSVEDGLSAIVADRFDVGVRFGERVERAIYGQRAHRARASGNGGGQSGVSAGARRARVA
ncbi:LysR substrate-binding domain-containing protein [Ralstonia sp. UBA689]|uniref:LysR substrate-binding domain-containing protein n=1 Tax=Ralstonia sp. UBA689 TaxID=1947373 RepID=UPI0025D5F6F4|nr:LysR substrate-binding domain-containing protein [Ralstonia sp. UBA689]